MKTLLLIALLLTGCASAPLTWVPDRRDGDSIQTDYARCARRSSYFKDGATVMQRCMYAEGYKLVESGE